MSDFKILQQVILRLHEELGKHKVRAFKGGGSSQGYYDHAERKGLGDTDPFDIDIVPTEKTKKKKSVKVSKAFLDLDEIDNSSQEVYTKDQPKKLNEELSNDMGVAWDLGYIYSMSDIRGPQSRTPYSGRERDFFYVSNTAMDAAAVARIVDNLDIIWRESDPYMYKYDGSKAKPIQVVAGPSEKNVGKQFSIKSQTARNLTKNTYTSKQSTGGDNGHTQLKAKVGAARTNNPAKAASKTNSPEDEWAQTGRIELKIAPLSQSRKEQILIITLAKGTGKEITIDPPKGGTLAGSGQSLTWSGAYTDKFLLELQDAKFTPGPFINEVHNSIIMNAEIKDPAKKSFDADSKGVLTWGQTIAVNLYGSGKYKVYQDERITADRITIEFTADEPVAKVAQSTGTNTSVDAKKLNQREKAYSGKEANVWLTSGSVKELDREMKSLSASLSKNRLSRLWKKGIKKIIIITSDTRPPSTATDNIIRYELDGYKISNPTFKGKFGNSKSTMPPIVYAIVSKFLSLNGYLDIANIKPVKNSAKFKPKKKVSEGIRDLDFDNSEIIDLGTASASAPGSSETSIFDLIKKDPSVGDKEAGIPSSPDGDVDIDVSVDVPSDIRSRVLKISAATGIKPAAIYGIERTESSGDPAGFAFNDQVFRKWLETKEERALADDIKISNAKIAARYGNNAKVTFKKAYQINPSAAIKAGAWGWYQVLGETSLPLYGNDPDTFIRAFKSNPMQHSINSFIRWVKNKGGSFINAINNDKHATWVKMYYGPRAFDPGQGGDKYVDRYIKAKNQWKA
jgi:hypothetical protein